MRTNVANFDPEVERVFTSFSRIYLGGIPAIITDDSAFLSFVCVLAATEALARYRYDDEKVGDRYKKFVTNYFPQLYAKHVDDLWDFRNAMVHAFSTGPFTLTHHHSELHLYKLPTETVVLNAEDFYGALLSAAQAYFTEVRTTPELKSALLERAHSAKGGRIVFEPIDTRSKR